MHDALTAEERQDMEYVRRNAQEGSFALRATLATLDRLASRIVLLEKVREAAKRFADEVDHQFAGTAIPAEIDTLRDALAALAEPGKGGAT